MQKNAGCQPSLGENACLTVIQKIEVITELGLAVRESVLKIANSLTLFQKLFFLAVNIFCRSH